MSGKQEITSKKKRAKISFKDFASYKVVYGTNFAPFISDLKRLDDLKRKLDGLMSLENALKRLIPVHENDIYIG